MPTNNRATTVLSMAASSLRESDSYVGAQFRRLRTRLGASGGDQGHGAKLTRLVYRVLRYGMKYVDYGAQCYEAQHRKRQLIPLKRKAAQLRLPNHRSCRSGLKPRMEVSDGSSWRDHADHIEAARFHLTATGGIEVVGSRVAEIL